MLTWKITNSFDSELDLPYFICFYVSWLKIVDQGNKSYVYIRIYMCEWLCGCMYFKNSKSFLYFIKRWERIEAQMCCIKLWLIHFNSAGIIFLKKITANCDLDRGHMHSYKTMQSQGHYIWNFSKINTWALGYLFTDPEMSAWHWY